MGGRRAPAPALNYRNNEFMGDMAAWRLSHSEDNEEQLERLRRNLRRAREDELTPRQRQMLRHVNKSTVSRTIARGRNRLKKCLKYSF